MNDGATRLALVYRGSVSESRPAESASLDASTTWSSMPDEPVPDLSMRTRLASLRARMFGVPAEPTRVGRFVLLSTLGVGGMGVVHAAYDPRLDRRIALKLVNREAATGVAIEARLIREAQAMARLSHPNVVQIHEVGVWDGRIFIAMELVAGRTLAAWLAAEERSWRDILAVFSDAGRGLAAAHAAGIVHRDFKPENVLVGDDGRARVTDFGLARGVHSDAHVDETWREPDDPLAGMTGPRTVTGAIAGTPAYMSPEQFLGEPATASGDQFSFCVALHHALHRAAPFPGRERHELADAVIHGRRIEPPRIRCPRRVHRALVRALARDPTRRFPDMQSLLTAIAPRPRWQLAVPALTLTAAAVAALILAPRDAPNPCSDPHALLRGTWDAPRRADLERIFLDSEVPDAAILWSTTAEALDTYGESAAAMHHHSCQAGQRGESSSELHVLRVACLRRRLAVVDGVVRTLATGDRDALRQAPLAATELADIDACSDDRALLDGMDPVPPTLAATIADIRRQLDDVRALELLGDLETSRTRSDAILAEARSLDHAPTRAEAAYQRGRLAVLAGTANADPLLREAHDLALASRYDALIPELLSWRVQQTATIDGSLHLAEELLRQAESWHKRHEATPSRRIALELARSQVADLAGDHRAAAAAGRRLIDLTIELHGPDHLTVGRAIYNYANNLGAAGRTRESIAEHRKALPVITRRVGNSHPLVADNHYSLAVSLLDVASDAAVAEAEAHLETAHRIFASIGDDAPSIRLADTHIAFAQVAHLRDDLVGADRHVTAALAVYDHYPDHLDRAIALSFRAALASERARHPEALALHRQARALFVAARGPTSDHTLITDINIAEILHQQDDYDAADRGYTDAIAALERVQGPDALPLGPALLDHARVQLALGRACDAQASLARESAWRERHADVTPDPDHAELSHAATIGCGSARR